MLLTRFIKVSNLSFRANSWFFRKYLISNDVLTNKCNWQLLTINFKTGDHKNEFEKVWFD